MMAAMRQGAPHLSVRRLCQLAGGGRTWYYTHPSPAAVAGRDVALRDAIEQLVLAFPGYGYRRVTKALARAGWTVNHKRVLRRPKGPRRQESLLCQLKRRFVATTDAAHGLPTAPNLLAGAVLTGPDQAWVADITYIRLPAAFAYLACLLDAFSRRCAGALGAWQLARTIDTGLTLAALDRALTLRRPAAGLLHHSDRGVQYASAAYVARPEAAGARLSMSAVGNPYDNATARGPACGCSLRP